ncbi:MAG: cellulose biosynthesis cyclic di-GMP-binding regulatory protein BcsB [Thermodesulfobacteriota bacterium]
MRLTIHRPLWAIAFCALGLPTALASPSEALQFSQNEGEYRIPLGWLNGGNRAPIELRGAEARKSVSLPVPQRIRIEDVKLEMVYTNSISMIPRSQLAVMLDNRVLAQLPVKANQPDNAARITLPLDGFRPGFREIGFRAAQHYTDECEDPSAPELYSQVDAAHSVLHMKTSRRPITPSLARLADIFDRRLWLDRYTLELMIPPGSLGQDEDMRQAAAQVSQSIAAIFDYLPVSVRINELAAQPNAPREGKPRFPGVKLPDKAWDGVLLGTRDQLAPFVSPDILAKIKEGYIGLFQSDQDPTRSILLISGVTPAQVRQAATMLNLPGIALPDRPDVSVSMLRMDQGYQRLKPIEDEKGWTSFANLGFETTTLKGMYPNPARLEFWVGREMFDPAKPYIDLELNFAYGVGFDKKSGLNILLNGQFIKALPMQNTHGEQFFRYKIEVPTISLQSGRNELQFLPAVIGEDMGGSCEPIFTENLLVSIFQDSRIELPPLADYVSVPDLGLLARSGLPYTRAVDGLGVGVLIADQDPATLGSALSLIAKLRQINKAPMTALRFVSNADALKGVDGLIVVGQESALPEAIRTEMDAFMPNQKWQAFNVGSLKGSDVRQGLKRWVDQPQTPLVQLTSIAKHASAELALSEGLGTSAALVQYVSPSAGVPVTVLTAAQGRYLEEGTQRLVEHSTWGAMDGSAMLWTMDGEATAKAYPVDKVFIGEEPVMSPGSRFFSDKPWLAILITLAVVLLAATLSWWLLRQRARRQDQMD